MKKTEPEGADEARSEGPEGAADRARFFGRPSAGLARLCGAELPGWLGLPSRPALFLLTAMLLVSLALLLDALAGHRPVVPAEPATGATLPEPEEPAAVAAAPAQLAPEVVAPTTATPESAPSGFVLPAVNPSSKLNNTSAEAPESNSASPPQLALDGRNPSAKEEGAPSVVPPPAPVQTVSDPPPEVRPSAPSPIEAPSLPPPDPPPAVAPPAVEPAPLPAVAGVGEAVPQPGDFDSVRNPHRGDSPMMTTWRMLGLQTLLAAALAAGPAAAGQADAVDAKKLDDIQKQLTEIQRTLDAFMVKDVGDLKVNVARAQADFLQLREQVARLQKELEGLRGQSGPQTRVAGFPPNGATGRLRLMNTFTAPMSIRINDRVFRLEPGQTQIVEGVPAGSFTYEVLGIQAPVARTLGANETYTIYVYPR